MQLVLKQGVVTKDFGAAAYHVTAEHEISASLGDLRPGILRIQLFCCHK